MREDGELVPLHITATQLRRATPKLSTLETNCITFGTFVDKISLRRMDLRMDLLMNLYYVRMNLFMDL